MFKQKQINMQIKEVLINIMNQKIIIIQEITTMMITTIQIKIN